MATPTYLADRPRVVVADRRRGDPPDTLLLAAPIAGRVLLALILVISGFGKLSDWQGSQAYMASKGLGFTAPLLAAATFIEIVGGLSLIAGWMSRFWATVTFGYLVVVTFVFHDFWNFMGQDRMMQTIQFLKNLSILGGLLYVVGFGPGPFSVDSRRTGYYE